MLFGDDAPLLGGGVPLRSVDGTVATLLEEAAVATLLEEPESEPEPEEEEESDEVESSSVSVEDSDSTALSVPVKPRRAILYTFLISSTPRRKPSSLGGATPEMLCVRTQKRGTVTTVFVRRKAYFSILFSLTSSSFLDRAYTRTDNSCEGIACGNNG